MELTKEVREYIVLFIDGSKKFLTKKQFTILMQASGGRAKGVVMDNSFIAFSSISKIMELEEYYKQYPDKRPQEYKKMKAEKSEEWTKEKRINAMQNMRKGVLKYKNGRGKGGKQVDDLIARIDNRIHELEGDEQVASEFDRFMA